MIFPLSLFILLPIYSVGAFRDANIIHDVLRDQKAEKAVELLTTLHSLRMQFASSGSSGGADGAGGGGPSSSALANYKETPEEAAQLEAVGATFDMYDTDGGGELDSKELNELMRSLGKGMDDSEAESMLQDLDGDGDGVSFG